MLHSCRQAHFKREANKCVDEPSLDEDEENCHYYRSNKVDQRFILVRPDQHDDLKDCDANKEECTNSEDELKLLYQLALLAVPRQIS